MYDKYLLHLSFSMHASQRYSSHKPMHTRRGSNSLLWDDEKNWSSFWIAWTSPTYLHLYRSQQLHSPFHSGQFPTREIGHVELRHHHPRKPPCQDLGRAAKYNTKISNLYWKESKESVHIQTMQKLEYKNMWKNKEQKNGKM